MTAPLRLARSTTVEACRALLGIEPPLVAQDADLLDVVRDAGRQPGTRVIGVVDPEGRIVGAMA